MPSSSGGLPNKQTANASSTSGMNYTKSSRNASFRRAEKNNLDNYKTSRQDHCVRESIFYAARDQGNAPLHSTRMMQHSRRKAPCPQSAFTRGGYSTLRRKRNGHEPRQEKTSEHDARQPRSTLWRTLRDSAPSALPERRDGRTEDANPRK